MEKIIVKGLLNESKILIGESYKNYLKYVDVKNIVFITDQNIHTHYKDFFNGKKIIILACGEQSKNSKTVNTIYNSLLKYEADRSTFILGVGGGVVCDITGFAASTYMRGLRFGFISTSLLSQADASVGGKNGINFHGFKNIVGTFNQPDFVIIDTDMLKTLPQDELSNGFSEIIKSSLIADKNLFCYLEKYSHDATRLSPNVIQHILFSSLTIKARIVGQDEREKQERKLLNLGHTIGHALEKIYGISHGNSVSVGMLAAAYFSYIKKYLNENELNRIKNILLKYNLPISIDLDKKKIKKVILKDKKRASDFLDFIFIKGIGSSLIERITFRELEDLIDDLY